MSDVSELQSPRSSWPREVNAHRCPVFLFSWCCSTSVCFRATRLRCLKAPTPHLSGLLTTNLSSPTTTPSSMSSISTLPSTSWQWVLFCLRAQFVIDEQVLFQNYWHKCSGAAFRTNQPSLAPSCPVGDRHEPRQHPDRGFQRDRGPAAAHGQPYSEGGAGCRPSGLHADSHHLRARRHVCGRYLQVRTGWIYDRDVTVLSKVDKNQYADNPIL